jgi:hypothetical protein
VLLGAAQGAEQVVSQGGDNTAAWLAFLGAMIVAAIAAGTAQWRLRAQLKHDRRMRDLDELRRFLDECARAASAASEAFLRVASHSPLVPRPRWWAPWRTAEERSLSEREETFWKLNERVSPLYQQLVLRVGEEHNIAKAFLAVQAALTVEAISLSEGVETTDPASDERVEAMNEAISNLREAYYGFLETARQTVGVDLA